MEIIKLVIIIYLKISFFSLSKKLDYDDLYFGKSFPFSSLLFFCLFGIFFYFIRLDFTFFTVVIFYLLFPLFLKKSTVNFLRFYYWFFSVKNETKFLVSRIQTTRTIFKTVIFYIHLYPKILFLISIIIFIFNIKLYVFVTVLWHIIVIFFFKLSPLIFDMFVIKECSNFSIELTDTGEKKLLLYKKKLLNYNNFFVEFFLIEKDFIEHLKI